MKKLLSVLIVLLIAGLCGIASRGFAAGQEAAPQEATPPKKDVPHVTVGDRKIPAEDVDRKNPVKPTEESIGAGRRFFRTQCAMCHGEHGDGKGDLAVELKLNMRDWTDPASLKVFTDGALFYIMTKGSERMPGQEGRMKAEQQWNVVNYIRSVAKKEAPKPEEKKP